MSREYLKLQYRNALLDHRLGRPDAIDELARITELGTYIYGFDFADELKEVSEWR